MKARPDAWYCDCGCGCVYDNSGQLGRGLTEEEAWQNAETSYRVQQFFKAKDTL